MTSPIRVVDPTAAPAASQKAKSKPPAPDPVPYSEESEAALLGCLLVHAHLLPTVQAIISRPTGDPKNPFETDFYLLRHKYIFAAMRRCYERDKSFDLITIGNELRALGKLEEVGGESYLMQLGFEAGGNPQLAAVYAGVVNRTAVRRKGMTLANEMLKLAQLETISVDDYLKKMDTMLIQVRQQLYTTKTRKLNLGHYYDVLNERLAHPQPMGFPSGVSALDKLLGGFQRGKLYVAPAVRHMGKTHLALSIARVITLAGIPTMLWTRENDEEEVNFKIAGMEVGVEPEKFTNGTCDPREMSLYSAAMGRLADLPLWITTDTNMTAPGIYQLIKQYKYDFGIEMVIVDYAQALKTGLGPEKDSSPYLRQRTAAECLFNASRELGVSILATAQLHPRGSREKKYEPKEEDILGGNDLATQADAVFFPFRPGRYDKMIHPSETKFIVSKNKTRAGGLGEAWGYFNLKTGRFGDDSMAVQA